MVGLFKSVLVAAALSGLSVFSSIAMANGNCLADHVGVCVEESELQLFGERAVEYTVTNHLEDRLFAFGVSNDAFGGRTSAGAQGWRSAYIDKEVWDAGLWQFDFFAPVLEVFNEHEFRPILPPAMVWRSGEQQPFEHPPLEQHNAPIGGDFIEPALVYLGSFESLFGTEDDHVSFFWNEYTALSALTYGVTSDNNFLQFADPRSDFSAFGMNGNVVATSVTAVPEPETYAMFLAGLGLLGFVNRKRQQA